MTGISIQMGLAMTALGSLAFLSFSNPKENKTKNEQKMNMEIWSDVVCPWCYIGKRRLEKALEQFEYADEIEIEYKSYQLDPTMQTDTSMTIAEYLAIRKGVSMEQAKEMNAYVSGIAAQEGLDYQLDKVIPLNTLQAHALLHYAKAKGKQEVMKERLMKGYFTENLNLDDLDVLGQLAEEVGLNGQDSRKAIRSKQYDQDVRSDIDQAHHLGLRGVPYFLIDKKYSISGAQPEEALLTIINKAYVEWQSSNRNTDLHKEIDGKLCTPQGDCD